MNQKNTQNSSDTFKDTLSNIKEFILDLIRKKKERVEKETKDRVDEILPSEVIPPSAPPQNTPEPPEENTENKSWLDKMKDKFS
jgi:hypothetical protein